MTFSFWFIEQCFVGHVVSGRMNPDTYRIWWRAMQIKREGIWEV
jgi:hypothetical protein